MVTFPFRQSRLADEADNRYRLDISGPKRDEADFTGTVTDLHSVQPPLTGTTSTNTISKILKRKRFY